MVAALLDGHCLDFVTASSDNSSMEILGHIQNGVVVLEGEATLPEGTRVSVSPIPPIPQLPQPPEPEIVFEPGKLPYVRGGSPGTWNLTNEMIAQILEDEDLEMVKV